MVKKGLCLLLALIMTLSLCGCGYVLGFGYFLFLVETGDDRVHKDTLFAFVQEQEEELLKAVEDRDFSGFENKGFIQNVNISEDAVEFCCGGAGIGSATSYVGFYYTPSNDITALWCAPSRKEALVPKGNGFEFKEERGDNRFYAEHICGNFYYYEMSF